MRIFAKPGPGEPSPLWDSAKFRFFVGFLPPFILSSSYWFVCLRAAPLGFQDDAVRWIANNPAISVIQVMVIPLSFGILLQAANPTEVNTSVVHFRKASVFVLILMLGLGAYRVFQD